MRSLGSVAIAALCMLAVSLTHAGADGDAHDKKSGPKVYKYLNGGTPSFSDVPPAKIPFVVFTPSCYACNIHSNIN